MSLNAETEPAHPQSLITQENDKNGLQNDVRLFTATESIGRAH